MTVWNSRELKTSVVVPQRIGKFNKVYFVNIQSLRDLYF